MNKLTYKHSINKIKEYVGLLSLVGLLASKTPSCLFRLNLVHDI